ncbi:hypothetical protein [Trichormus azollae]|uniref:hypothetical protein n=1 Tax=Trichormus azollae TaxID=1164 RepID=UPI00325E9B5B
MQKPYHMKQAQVLVQQVKNQMIQRLDSDGEELFLQAYTFFKQSTFDTKIVKLIQPYSGLPGHTRLLLQYLKCWTDQYGERPVNSQAQTTISRVLKTIWEY